MDFKNTVNMSQDIIADGLNEIMNAKRARKDKVVVNASRFFLDLLEIAKREGYIVGYKQNGNQVEIVFKLHECRAIKPRFNVHAYDLDKYMRRYLPSRHLGIIVISTSKGLLTHKEALDQGLGGSLIAFFT